MKKFYYLLVLVLIAFFSVPAVATDHGYGKMRPMQHERLSDPVSLSKSCEDVQIIEWKPTPGHVKHTKITKKATKVVDKACNRVVDNFYSFVRSKGYKPRVIDFDTSLSFLPADLRRRGEDPRNLNDITYRFVHRSDQDPLWGFYQRRYDWAYITNDVLKDNGKVNKDFTLVVVHELFHAMSYSTGVFHQHRPASNRERIEEEMAEQFTEHLGLGRYR
jgi:hypothetical protein